MFDAQVAGAARVVGPATGSAILKGLLPRAQVVKAQPTANTLSPSKFSAPLGLPMSSLDAGSLLLLRLRISRGSVIILLDVPLHRAIKFNINMYFAVHAVPR